jgi:hypothetical protein
MLADDRVGSLFAELLDEFIGFGVSGALPKVLVQERATIHDARWILKAGDAKLPGLVVNEFFTMRAAQLAGLETPEFKLADNGTVLAVRRFDHDHDQDQPGVGRRSASRTSARCSRCRRSASTAAPWSASSRPSMPTPTAPSGCGPRKR